MRHRKYRMTILYLLMQEAHAEKLSEIQGEKKNIEWGSQIRSYVLHPYSMVKDNRSGYESNDPKKILDGKPIMVSILFFSIKFLRIVPSSPPRNKTP